MKTEERLVQDKLRIYELDFTRGIVMRKRSRKYVNNDAALKQLVQHFDQNPNMNNEDFFRHLRAIQYRLADNEINHWDD